jgi:hypothetical protein
MSVVEIINVAIVFDGRVPTSGAVLVIVLGMKGNSHARPPFLEKFRFRSRTYAVV